MVRRRIHPRNTPRGMLQRATRFPWQLLIIVPLIVALAVSTFLYMSRAGGKIMPSITQLFYKLSDTGSSVIATPQPSFPITLPQVGSMLYTVETGDSCDSILTFQMNMQAAGEVFSDANPETVQALNHTLGQDCHTLQPGLVPITTPTVSAGSFRWCCAENRINNAAAVSTNAPNQRSRPAAAGT